MAYGSVYQQNMSSNQQQVEKSNQSPVRGSTKINDDHHPYDISSMSEEGSINASPSFENVLKKPDPNSTGLFDAPMTIAEEKIAPEQSHHLESIPSAPNNTNGSPKALQKPPASPAGSLSSIGSPSRSQQPLLQVPRFYESEDDGPGSLVFVESNSTMGGVQAPSPSQQRSPNYQQRYFVAEGNDKGQAKQFRMPNLAPKGLSILPYPQRKKVAESLGEASQYMADKKPPFVPKSFLAEKYKVSTIPPFRSANQQTTEGKADTELGQPSPQSSPEKANGDTTKKLQSSSFDRNRPPLAQSGVPKQTRTSIQEVICPPPPPIQRTPQSPGDSPDSGFHIRCSSQTSVSSLGSNAVDDVKVEKYQQPPHNGKMQQHGYPQLQPQNYYHSYNMQQKHGQLYQNMPNVDIADVLGQDIATFLHGERIAAAQTNHNLPHPRHVQKPPYWNPGYGGVMWQGAPYQHHIPQLNPEPLPPPLTTVPNMELRRARLPSISDDDWTEELEKIIDKNSDEEQFAPQKREQPNKKEWDYRRSQNHHIQQPQPQQPYPYPNVQGYYNHRMANYYTQNQMMPPSNGYEWPRDQHQYRNDYQNRNQDHPNERSSLLDRSGNRAYSTRYNEEDNYNRTMQDICGNGSSNKLHREESERRRKKKKSRRREKVRVSALFVAVPSRISLISFAIHLILTKTLRSMQASDSSEEKGSDRRSHARSRKSKGRRRRKKRDGADDTSDTYSESLMSQSLTDRSIAKEISGGFCNRFVVSSKLMICNLPLSASAISFSIVLLGTLWFTWAQEILSSCKEVTFHSSQCSLPEFPGKYQFFGSCSFKPFVLLYAPLTPSGDICLFAGCYFCDEFNHVYQMVTHFHSACSYIGGVSVVVFLAKALLNWKSFIDEMSSPTTSSPAGLIFMTMAMAFIGKGDIGEMLVILASLLHLILVSWFIYMSLAYQTMPGKCNDD